jgi:sec-independent protein translocase protein TatB
MFNLDPGKLLIIGVVAILLLGPDRLPQVARQVGDAWRSFSEFRHRMEAEVRSNIPDLPSSSDLARLTRSPTALLNHLGNMTSGESESVIEEEQATTWVTSTDSAASTAPVGGEMSWVTADFSSPGATPDSEPAKASAHSFTTPPRPQRNPESNRSLEPALTGDANLN